MADLHDDKHVEAVRRELRLRAWDRRRLESTWGQIEQQRELEQQRNRRVKVAGSALLGVALMLALVVGVRAALTPSGPLPVATHTAALVNDSSSDPASVDRIALGDETEARIEKGTQLDVREQTRARVVVAIRTGAALFRVRHDPTRLFRVEAGDVAIEDLGTTFEVKRQDRGVFVAVSEGAVTVSFPEHGTRGNRTLRAGESGVYPPVRAADDVSSMAAAAPIPAAGESAPASVSARERPAVAEPKLPADWRELARAGKHRQAYELLAPTAFREVRDDPADILLASDVARLSRHSGEAVALLRKLLARHSPDPRAPSAAFTLGWLLMNDLGRHAEAAQAFARAEVLAPRGNLAEDAAARAVEAWSRAGNVSRANTEFARYKRAYPAGRHLAMLQRLVGTR